MAENYVFKVEKIDDASWYIEESGVRAFLFTGKSKALMIDSGYGNGNIREIAETLTGLPIMLANTHADWDHTGGNSLFERAYMHPSEYDRYKQTGREGAVSPLWEGGVIELGERRFEVILIPGHTPGSIALLDIKNRVLIPGDSVQTGTIYMFGPGRNINAYIESMNKLYAMRERFDTIYTSHGPFPVTGDNEVILRLSEGAKQVLDGKIPGTEAQFEAAANYDAPVKAYDAGVAEFLY